MKKGKILMPLGIFLVLWFAASPVVVAFLFSFGIKISISYVLFGPVVLIVVALGFVYLLSRLQVYLYDQKTMYSKTTWGAMAKLIVFPFKFYSRLIYRKKMNSALTLKEAIELGFKLIPLGEKFIGPKGQIVLVRNLLPVGHKEVAEISVELAGPRGSMTILFFAKLKEDGGNYKIFSVKAHRIDSWDNNW